MTWTIEYARSVRKSVEKLHPSERRRIREFVEGRLVGIDNPRTIGKALSGPLATLWSYRVGDHRIICDIQDDKLVVLVLAIGNRREV
ncbi:MAG: type II toxin-antitoxin system RelE/ParE family toxin [Rhizobiaceae bacterium]|nr:type II toxin-antitoxin system RelE/ParE family toxin [Rhizobiaceae bacterium]